MVKKGLRHTAAFKFPTIAHTQKSTSYSDRSRPTVTDQSRRDPSGSTLCFPSCGPMIGGHFTATPFAGWVYFPQMTKVGSVLQYPVPGLSQPITLK